MSNLSWSAYLLASFSALAFLASLWWRPAPPPKYDGLAGWQLPDTVAGFQSQGDETIDPVVRAALSTADIVSRTYRSGSGNIVQFTVIGGTDRSALHDTRSCMLGAGWRIEDDHTETIPGTNIQTRVCRAVKDSPRIAYEVMNLYVVDGQVITEVTQIRAQMLLSALVGRKNRPTVFVRFMRPLPRGSQTGDAANREQFQMFAAQMWNTLRPDQRDR
jgi:EpsI family protein